MERPDGIQPGEMTIPDALSGHKLVEESPAHYDNFHTQEDCPVSGCGPHGYPCGIGYTGQKLAFSYFQSGTIHTSKQCVCLPGHSVFGYDQNLIPVYSTTQKYRGIGCSLNPGCPGEGLCGNQYIGCGQYWYKPYMGLS